MHTSSQAAQPEKKDVVYVCPMDPEVRVETRRMPEVRHGAGAGSAAGPNAKTEYVCPMHPEIVRASPGACPICGMALEPRDGRRSDEEANPELDDMTRRFWVGVASDRAVCLLARCPTCFPGSPLQHAVSPRLLTWLQLAAGDAGGAVGRLAVLRARLAVDRQPQPQHVHADRARRRARRTSTASSATLLPGRLSGIVPRPRR